MSGSINCTSEEDITALKWILKNISDYLNRIIKTSNSVEYYKWGSSDHLAADSELKHSNLTSRDCHWLI